MPDYPPAVLAAGAEAVNQVYAKRGWNKPAPWWTKEVSAAVLDAAAPLLAEAWGVTERVRQIGRENRIGELYAEHAERMRELDDGAAENVSASSAATGEDGEP